LAQRNATQRNASSVVHFPMALFTWHANPKYFLFHLSHQIFKRMHGALNVGKKTN
jgi:hypothetical protein